LLLGLAACGAEDVDRETRDTARSGDASRSAGENPHLRIVRLLAEGEAVFGIFSGDHTPRAGAAMAENRETDFVFYSLESGPFDLDAMAAYAEAMEEAAGDRGTHPLALRIPPIRDGADEARERVRLGLDAGVAAIVFPHVESAEDARIAVEATRASGLWPLDPDGPHVNMLIVEDRTGVENAPAIASTPGVSVVFAGPGDLSRAYDRDAEAVEEATQTILAACLEAGVPCGITAGADDIADRLEQGFRVIIVTEPEALAVGRDAAGRTDGGG
ncbi:MAG: aldolase/citrate lyase family protein, partial [Gemmatimonadota bacterium]|nr:aldolase/citrate lyase family protein [Gemmatimonadota bacterium]